MLGEVWTSGDLAKQRDGVDYRSEWIGERFIERITFAAQVGRANNSCAHGTPLRRLGARHLVRFWLLAADQVIDKGFGEEAEPLGYFAPITKGLVRNGDTLRASPLHLGIVVDQNRRITVSGEEEFERAVEQGALEQDEVVAAEERIREMTTAAAANQWPVPFVRHFAIMREGER